MVTTGQLFTTPNAPSQFLRKSQTWYAITPCVIAYAIGECLVGHVPTNDNPADICTKIIPGGQKHDHLVGLILYDIVDHK